LAKVVASKGLEEVLSNDGLGKSQGRPNFNVDTVVLAPTVIQEVNGIHVVPVSLHAVPPGQPRKGGRGLCGSQTGNSAAAGAGFSKFHGLDEGPPGFVPNTIHVDILKNPIVLHDFPTMQVGGISKGKGHVVLDMREMKTTVARVWQKMTRSLSLEEPISLWAQSHLGKRGQEALALDPVAQGIWQKKQKPVGLSNLVKAMAAAVVQTRPPQWICWAGTVEGLGTLWQFVIFIKWWRKSIPVSYF